MSAILPVVVLSDCGGDPVVIVVRPSSSGAGGVEAVQVLSAPGAHIAIEVDPTLDASGALSLAHPKHPTDRGVLILERAVREHGHIEVRVAFQSESSFVNEVSIVRGRDGTLVATATHTESLDTQDGQIVDKDPRGRIRLSQPDIDHTGTLVLELELPCVDDPHANRILLESR